MEKDYSQIFWVGRNNTRFRGVSIAGYLPALEAPAPQKPKPELLARSLTKEERQFNKAPSCPFLIRK